MSVSDEMTDNHNQYHIESPQQSGKDIISSMQVVANDQACCESSWFINLLVDH